ncbi:hypothetical protein A4X06_0g5710 [Tilletia controversa]|uniref:Glycerophosphocholine acyltransferase 1 n=1 Tax=Tilletia controversa TaxID=13291 RepID=A0A8X7MQW1_9BASI|nr:hypothetical protein CF328_g5653 [Tilletia controversa]KAE8245382.1 hypothetical protein A4X06_0g5710 [Tilletia controversa]CAD6974199.1 unnamed protein product [Tilletia controversa]
MVTAVPYKRTSSSLTFATEMGDAFASAPPSEDGHSSAFHSSEAHQARPFFERTFSSSSATSTSDGFSIASAPALSAPITDLIETFWESRLDLLDRRFKDWREGVKRSMVEEAKTRVKRTKEKALSRAEVRAMEKEVVKMRKKAAERVDKLGKQWRDAKTIRLRDKVSFVIGVLNLVCSSLLITTHPELVPLAYSIQCIYFLPLRVFSYSRRRWHYFLFDYCYYVSALCNVFLWIYPDSRFLFQASYCAAHGPLAWSVVTWRNSMVFHSLEKMTSLFIHIYPPLVFTTIVHYIPRSQAEKMYPALIGLETLDGWTCFAFTCGVYSVWQLLYWTFISTSKKGKIESGIRINSYSTMTRGKGAIANLLGKYPATLREPLFMALQFVYTVITTLPAPWLLYPHKITSTVFLMVVLTISVWNGATWYVEVWARKFEKELLALRAEMEVAKQQELVIAEANSGGFGGGGPSGGSMSAGVSIASESANVSRRNSAEVYPFSMEVAPPSRDPGGDASVEAVLEKARERVEEEDRKDR